MKKFFIIFVLFLAGACTSTPSTYNPTSNVRIERLQAISYSCSYNSYLCQELLAKIDSGTVSQKDLRFFILVTQHAWSETAANIQSQTLLNNLH